MAKPARDTLPFLHLLPNMITILGLCAGLTAIRFAIEGRVEWAAGLIVFAAAIDGLDGLVARRLKATSLLGAELDSLSDFVCFGVAPALIVFRFGLVPDTSLGWGAALIFAICCCLRLARFNVMRGMPDAPRHFVGVPAPAGAWLALLPAFATMAGIVDLSRAPIAVGIWMVFVALLMVSRVPTPSVKGMRVQRDKAIWVLIGLVAVIGLMISRFWLSLCLIGLAYTAVVIYQGIKFRRF